MEIETKDKIRLKQMEISIEKDPNRKQTLQRELQNLQMKLEIEQIKKKMQQLTPPQSS